jgi:hypothetical protein
MRKIALLNSATAMAVAFANAASAPKTAPEITGVANIALPEPERKGGRGTPSPYPFDSLTEVGMFFGVKNKDKRAMSSIVSNQNKKHRTQATDENGMLRFKTNSVKAPDGTVSEVPDIAKPIYDHSRKFEAREVTAEIAKLLKGTPAEGSKVVVVRTI